jgi:hypothetical protein
MRTRVITLGVACVFLFLISPAHGQTSLDRSPGHEQQVSENKDPAAILEIGAAIDPSQNRRMPAGRPGLPPQ